MNALGHKLVTVSRAGWEVGIRRELSASQPLPAYQRTDAASFLFVRRRRIATVVVDEATCSSIADV
jgi:hypothetical protein